MHGRYQSTEIGRLVDMQKWLRCEKYYAKILNPITLWPFQSRPSCIVSGNFFVQFHFYLTLAKFMDSKLVIQEKNRIPYMTAVTMQTSVITAHR